MSFCFAGKTHRFQFYLDERLYKLLQRISKNSSLTPSQILNKILCREIGTFNDLECTEAPNRLKLEKYQKVRVCIFLDAHVYEKLSAISKENRIPRSKLFHYFLIKHCTENRMDF